MWCCFAATLPIAVAANVVRVAALVLIAYYGGVGAIEGPLSRATGIALFAVALVLLLLLDGLIGGVIALARRARLCSQRRATLASAVNSQFSSQRNFISWLQNLARTNEVN